MLPPPPHRNLGLSRFENVKGAGIPSICEHEKVVPTDCDIPASYLRELSWERYEKA